MSTSNIKHVLCEVKKMMNNKNPISLEDKRHLNHYFVNNKRERIHLILQVTPPRFSD